MPLSALNRKLTVVDVHGDFKAKTHVVVCWCFPFHFYTLQRFCCSLFDQKKHPKYTMKFFIVQQSGIR